MCLLTVKATHNKGEPYLEKFRKLPKWGWKVFRKGHNEGLYGEYYFTGISFPNNRWVHDPHTLAITYSYDDDGARLTYPTGFHLFLTREDAREWKGENDTLCIRKVLFKDVVAIGKQDELDVIVARSIKIIDGR